MNITAIGEDYSNSGLSHAFRLHVVALQNHAAVTLYNFNQSVPPSNDVGYVHGGPTAVSKVRKQARQIGYLVCESTELPKSYRAAFANVDEIWTCSNFCKSVFERYTRKPVKLIPHYTEAWEFTLNENEKPVFLIAFNGNSRPLRKLPSLALKAIKAVQPGARVVLKCLNVEPSILRWLCNEASGLELELITTPQTTTELAALYRRIDIVVSLHAAEGFGLHLLEAMSYGKRVVATGFGGNVDFMNEKNSFLVDYDLVKTNDHYFTGLWAKPNLRQAQEAVAAAVETVHNDEFSLAIKESVQHFNLQTTSKLTGLAL